MLDSFECPACLLLWTVLLVIAIGTLFFRSKPKKKVDMSSAVAQFVKQCVTKRGVVLFTKAGCPYCTMAKGVFDELKVDYDEIDLNKRDDGGEVQNVLAEMTGARSVPRVFINGKCIGGGSETTAMHKNGQLQILLEEMTNHEAGESAAAVGLSH